MKTENLSVSEKRYIEKKINFVKEEFE